MLAYCFIALIERKAIEKVEADEFFFHDWSKDMKCRIRATYIRMQHRTQYICALEILEIEPEIVQLSRETWQLLMDVS